MSLSEWWKRFVSTRPPADVAQAQASLQRLIQARQETEDTLKALELERAEVMDTSAHLELAALLGEEAHDLPERRARLQARRRELDEDLSTRRLMLDRLAEAIPEAEAAGERAAFAAEQAAVRALVSEYQQVGEEMLARVEDLLPRVARLGTLASEMENRYTALAPASRALGISDIGVAG